MMAYVVLNCLLFVPYGFVWSMFSFVHERRKIVQCALVSLISLITSLLIEVIQLITGRGFYEVQDIVFNTLGGIIGWIIFMLLFKIVRIVATKVKEK